MTQRSYFDCRAAATDLRKADLRDADLSDVFLSGVDLGGAKLSGANLSGANLSGARLVGAKLRGARLIGANLSGADLSYSVLSEADLSEAGLRNANLAHADLGRASLCEANLSEANLHVTFLAGAFLGGAKFSGANLGEAEYLDRADMTGADFSGVDLSGIILRERDLRGTTFRGADMSRSDLTGSNLTGGDLTGTDLREANLIDAQLDRCTLTNAKLWETQRAGWSIGQVICDRCCWDRDGLVVTHYGPGDFERAFAEKPSIVLEYPNGIRPVDLAMLPLVVEQLQREHPETLLHVRSIQDEGGKATVTITVDDNAGRNPGVFREEVNTLRSQLKSIQTQLLEEERFRIEAEGQMKLVTQHLLPMMERAMGAKYHIEHAGHVGDISHSHDFQAGQTTIHHGPSLDDVRKLIEAIQDRPDEIRGNATDQEVEELQAAVADLRAQLEAPQPDQSILKKAVGTVARITEKVGTTGLAELAKQAAITLF